MRAFNCDVRIGGFQVGFGGMGNCNFNINNNNFSVLYKQQDNNVLLEIKDKTPTVVDKWGSDGQLFLVVHGKTHVIPNTMVGYLKDNLENQWGFRDYYLTSSGRILDDNWQMLPRDSTIFVSFRMRGGMEKDDDVDDGSGVFGADDWLKVADDLDEEFDKKRVENKRRHAKKLVWVKKADREKKRI